MANNVSNINEEDRGSNGKPLEINLKKIDTDPNQPRRVINSDRLNELADSIRQRNVKQPISIRINPSMDGRYLINAGERRYRASIIAGKTTIPAFIDETFDDYDQVIENEQRENLTAMELALFIDKKSKDGIPKTVIAKYLSRSQNIITDHLAMIDMPDPIADAYRNGRVKTAKTINELRKVYKLDPVLVREWIANVDFITRGNVQALREQILVTIHNIETTTIPKEETFTSEDKRIKQPVLSSTNDIGEVTGKDIIEKGLKQRQYVAANRIEVENAQGIHDPLILVSYDDKRAAILLHKYPSVQGRIWIKFDSGREMEVGSSVLQIISISET